MSERGREGREREEGRERKRRKEGRERELGREGERDLWKKKDDVNYQCGL